MMVGTPAEHTIEMTSNGSMIGITIEIQAGLLAPEAFPIPLLGWWLKVRIPNGETATKTDHAVNTGMIAESLAKTMTQIATGAAIQAAKAEVQSLVTKSRTIAESLAKTMTQIATGAAIQAAKAEVQSLVTKSRTRPSSMTEGTAAEMIIATGLEKETADEILAGVIVQGIGSVIGAVAEVAAGIEGARTEAATWRQAVVMMAMFAVAAAAAPLSFHRRHPAAVSALLQSEPRW
jgi:hypothetical protein